MQTERQVGKILSPTFRVAGAYWRSSLSSSSRIPGNSDRRIADASRDVAQRIKKRPRRYARSSAYPHDRTGKPPLFPAIFPDLFRANRA